MPDTKKIVSVSLLFIVIQYSCLAKSDTTYIGSFKQNFSAKIYGANSFTALIHNNVTLGMSDLYMPNVPPYFGLGASWKGIGGSLSYGFDFMRDKKLGKTQYLDWQYHHYSSWFVFDFFGQAYKGFYTTKEVDGENVITLHPDVSLIKLGGFFQYNFNHKRFSYRAAFDQTEKQLKSAGTPLVCCSFYYTNITGDSLFRKNDDDLMHHYLLGPSGGYAYTWVINKRNFLTGSCSIGFNVGLENLSKKVDIYPTIFPRIAWGYNADTWSLGISAVYNTVYISLTDNNQLSMNTLNAQLTFIKRIHFQSKFLDKVTFRKKQTENNDDLKRL